MEAPSLSYVGTLSTTSSFSSPELMSALLILSLPPPPAVVNVPNVVTLPPSSDVRTEWLVVPLATLDVASGITSTTARSISVYELLENSRNRCGSAWYRLSSSSTSVSKMEPRSPMVVMVAKEATERSSLGPALTAPEDPPGRTAALVTPEMTERPVPPPPPAKVGIVSTTSLMALFPPDVAVVVMVVTDGSSFTALLVPTVMFDDESCSGVGASASSAGS
mmetsp:Transcript_1467/g.2689  ORF Transcript_1467/g.2689 Transcript_1467/m.2689 type:complete len:221 (-) Transcript_1467:30-692(-)